MNNQFDYQFSKFSPLTSPIASFSPLDCKTYARLLLQNARLLLQYAGTSDLLVFRGCQRALENIKKHPKGNKRVQKQVRLWARKTLEGLSHLRGRLQGEAIKALGPMSPKGSKFQF